MTIEVLPDGRIREGYSTYSPKHPVYECQSKKSAECTHETRGLYANGVFGYAGEIPAFGRLSVAICKPCFVYEFWLEQLRKDARAPESFAIVNGRHYVICEEQGHPTFRGFGGQRFVIQFFDGREVITTNLWAQDEIPAEFRDRMPDNARFG